MLEAAGETLELNEEEEYSEPFKKEERFAGSSKSKSFDCKECGTSYHYANFYYDTAKKHDPDMGGFCPLKKAKDVGIFSPSKDHVTNQGLIFCAKNYDTEVIDLE